MLIGPGAAGKTTLRIRLEKQQFEETDQTDGIEITRLKLKAAGANGVDLHVNVYDLGGQDEYMATHPLFMEARSIHCLTVDLQAYKRNPTAVSPQRFVRNVRARLGDKAIIILVGTHAEDVSNPVRLAHQLNND